MKRESFFKKVLRRGLFPAAILLAAALFLWALGKTGAEQSRQGREQLEQTLRRWAVVCYAQEGVYPPDTEYLERHYGVQIDHDRYAVFYEVFAENIMPQITVVEK